MAFQRVPDTFQVVVKGQLQTGKIWNNVLYYHDPGVLTQVIADSYCDLVTGNYTELLGVWSTQTSVFGITITDLDTEGAPQFESTSGAPIIGTAGGDAMPNEVSALIGTDTSFRGRSGRGRIFIPGFAESASDGQGPSSGAVAALSSFITEYLTHGTPVVVSRYSGTHLVAGPGGQTLRRPLLRGEAVTHDVVSAQADGLWVSQRRRRPAA